MESRKHRQLKQIALRWVQNTGCIAFACEVSFGYIGIADVAGIKKNGDIYIVEAKISNADMKSDIKRRKFWKLENVSAPIDFVYYIVADGVDTSVLDTSIGILDENGRKQRNARRRDRKRPADLTKDFEKFARTCSWRAYGRIINGQKEQLEFNID